MLAQLAGEMVRGHRVAKGLSQAQLARNAGVSRTVLSRLEQGKARAVQTDILDRLFEALGVKPMVLSAAASDDRKRARMEQQHRLDQARSRHLRLALDLANDGRATVPLISKARERVDLWRQEQICSAYYIDRWARVLDLPPRGIAKEMASFGDWEDAMFQNSPWPWA